MQSNPSPFIQAVFPCVTLCINTVGSHFSEHVGTTQITETVMFIVHVVYSVLQVL